MSSRIACLQSLSSQPSPNFSRIALMRSMAFRFFLPWYSFTRAYIASATCCTLISFIAYPSAGVCFRCVDRL
jgi:hypothetical protein